MPERKTLERARKAKSEGNAPTTQAGEFVREEIEHIREGKHGARSTKQAIAIGLSKARRAGVKLKPPKKGPGVGAHTEERESCVPRRSDWNPQEAIGKAITCDTAGAQTGIQADSVSRGALEAGTLGGHAASSTGDGEKMREAGMSNLTSTPY
jgi:hypothetical protein